MNDSEFTDFSNNIYELEKGTSDCLVLSFVGEVSSGKSTAIKKLFNVNPGDISAVPGSTKQIKHKFLKKNVLLLDTPGLGDINTSISGITKRVLNLTDLFIITLSAQGGLKETDKNTISQVSNFNKPLLILITKLDTISNRNERRELVRHTKANLCEMERKDIHVFGVMLDVDDRFRQYEPILNEVENDSKIMILEWLSTQLHYNSKVLLLSKISKSYRKQAVEVIQSYISNLSWTDKKFAFSQKIIALHIKDVAKLVASKYERYTLSDSDIQNIIEYADYDWFSSYIKLKDLPNDYNLNKNDLSKFYNAWGLYSSPHFLISPPIAIIDGFFLRSFETRLLLNIITAGMITSKFLYEDKLKTIREVFEEIRKEILYSFKLPQTIINGDNEFSFINS